jgi:hypothetical protein
MTKQIETTGYQVALKNWPTKLAGPKVTLALLNTAHALGCRAGKQALAMAMYLREGGASDGQVKAACIAGWGSSGSHHNKRRDIQGAGLVKNAAVGVSDANGHKVYAITLTAKGEGKVKLAEAPAKPAGKVAAKKAEKVSPKPQNVPVTVNEPLPGIAAEIQQAPAQ